MLVTITFATQPLPFVMQFLFLQTPTAVSLLIAPLPTLLPTNPQSLAPASLVPLTSAKTVLEIAFRLRSFPTLLNLVWSPPVIPPRTHIPTVIPNHVFRQTPA
jgi:hypothetical protein